MTNPENFPQYPDPRQQPGGYPQQPGGYPQQPGGYPTPPPQGYNQAPPTPNSVIMAFRIWVALVAVSVLGVILDFASLSGDREDVIQEILEAGNTGGATMTRDTAESIATATVFIGAAIGLLLAGLLLFFAFKMKAGKNWARIVLTVVGGLSALLSLIGIAAGGAGSLLAILSIGLIVAATVFMFRPDAGPYFQKRPAY